MTPSITRALTVATTVALAATTLGCGLVGKATNLVASATVLSDFADRLGKSQQLTYTAEYVVRGDGTEKVTLVQQPPDAAYVSASGRFIFTPDFMYLCDTQGTTTTCQKSPNQATDVGAADAGYISGVAGPGFITPEIAIGLIAAAALVPGAKVAESHATIAGQKSLCAAVTGLDAAASPGETDAPRNFTVCVTEAGVLARFSGTSADGRAASIELTRYSDRADPSAFQPPAGAEVVDVTHLQPGGGG